MIQYDTNGVTLFYIDSTGRKISKNPMDGDAYSKLDVIMAAQLAAETENKTSLDHYQNQLASAQVNVDAGRPVAAPVKPLRITVDDNGNTVHAPFNPPLPDLVPLKVTAPSTGLIAQPSVDKNAIMYAMITAIYKKMFPGG